MQILYEVLFTNGFINDKISIKINNNEVISNTELISDKSDGVTNLSVKIFTSENGFIVKNSKSEKEIYLSQKNDTLTISVNFKNEWQEFVPIKANGKYILITGSDKLVFVQQINEPEFD